MDEINQSSPSSRDINSRRTDCLEWDEWLMATAFLTAQRSKDPVSQVGAVIVNDDKRIVGTGYNGFPKGCKDDEFPWNKQATSKYDSKYLYVVHAEVNAILNKICADIYGCKMYVGLFPCNECAKVIIQSGIKEVIYLSDKHAHKVETQAAKRMFNAAGVAYSIFVPKKRKIVIDFDNINWNYQRQVQDTPSKAEDEMMQNLKENSVKRKQDGIDAETVEQKRTAADNYSFDVNGENVGFQLEATYREPTITVCSRVTNGTDSHDKSKVTRALFANQV